MRVLPNAHRRHLTISRPSRRPSRTRRSGTILWRIATSSTSMERVGVRPGLHFPAPLIILSTTSAARAVAVKTGAPHRMGIRTRLFRMAERGSRPPAHPSTATFMTRIVTGRWAAASCARTRTASRAGRAVPRATVSVAQDLAAAFRSSDSRAPTTAPSDHFCRIASALPHRRAVAQSNQFSVYLFGHAALHHANAGVRMPSGGANRAGASWAARMDLQPTASVASGREVMA